MSPSSIKSKVYTAYQNQSLCANVCVCLSDLNFSVLQNIDCTHYNLFSNITLPDFMLPFLPLLLPKVHNN